MIYYTDLPDIERFGDWKRYMPFLSEQRILKIERLKREADRRAGTVAFLLLRYAIYNEKKIKETPVFVIAENGKPMLSENDICFNLSHCDCAVACAVATENVGVDVQPFAPVKDSVARRVLSEREFAFVTQTDCPERTFTSLWTMKESFGKYSGDGIGYDMRNTSFPNPVVGYLPYQNGFFSLIEDEFFSVCGYSKNTLPVQKVSFSEIMRIMPIL